MSMRIWNPFQEIRRLEDEISKAFGDFRGDMTVSPHDRLFSPLTDVKETEDEIIIEMNLPGIKKDDLTIEATPEGVNIKAESKTEMEHENEKVHCRERVARKYIRSVGFPTTVNPKDAKTVLQDGVLTINFPKSEQAKAVKLIPD
ncbi:MAG: Hsp20/alpha crystallin family protein [Candidatus Thorarchaeota archaeon]